MRIYNTNPLKDLRSNIIEFPSGDYKYIGFDKGILYAGGATNVGIIHEFEMSYDFEDTLANNLQAIYDMITKEHPEYLDELQEKCTRKKQSTNEDWTTFVFDSGDESYIAVTELDKDRMLRKYRGRVEKDGKNQYLVHIKECIRTEAYRRNYDARNFYYRANDTDYTFVCSTTDTSTGFRHECTLYGESRLNGTFAKMSYQNRTWEAFEYQSVMLKAIENADIPLDDKKVLNHKIKELELEKDIDEKLKRDNISRITRKYRR